MTASAHGTRFAKDAQLWIVCGGIAGMAANFWQMWRTTFAFQNCYSATELKVYFIRFIQEFSRIHTLSVVMRTVYNQYDSMVVPLQQWILDQGVDVRFGIRVTRSGQAGA